MFRERIHEQYQHLSPRFRSLADYILENTLEVSFLTATQLAQRVGVDPATVVRFSQELGYSGYRALSREIKDFVNHQLNLRHTRQESSVAGSPEHVGAMLDALSDRVLDMKAEARAFVDAARCIHHAQRVIVTGASFAAHLAVLWSTYLELLGIPCRAVPLNSTQTALLLRDIGEGDLLIVISLGLSLDTESGRLLQAARQLGTQTVSVTATPNALSARAADVNLVAPVRTSQGYPSFDAVAIQLSILWQTLIALNPGKAERNVRSALEGIGRLEEGREEASAFEVAALMRLWNQPAPRKER